MIVETTKLRNREYVTLTSYIFDDSKEMLNGKKRPGIIICPGGANLFCSDREAEPIALRFNAMGYHAFVLRYSVYQKGKLSKNDFFTNKAFGIDEDSLFPNPMLDIAAAMLYIRDKSDIWLINADQIGLCGFSAGGHNVLMYSVYYDKEIITSYFNRTTEDLKPAVTIVGYGISDYTEKIKDEQGVLENNPIYISLFGTSNPSKEQLEACSPAHLVSETTPPMFLWCTSQDELVPAKQTLFMGLALAQKGIDYEMHIFEKGKHGYALADQSTAKHVDQISPIVEKWADMVKIWLYEHMPVIVKS